ARGAARVTAFHDGRLRNRARRPRPAVAARPCCRRRCAARKRRGSWPGPEDRPDVIHTVALEDVLGRRLGPLIGEVRDLLQAPLDAARAHTAALWPGATSAAPRPPPPGRPPSPDQARTREGAAATAVGSIAMARTVAFGAIALLCAGAPARALSPDCAPGD